MGDIIFLHIRYYSTYYLALLVVLFVWRGIVHYRMFLKTKLISLLLTSFAGWLSSLTLLLLFFLWKYLSMLLAVVFFILIGSTGVLYVIAMGFINTKEEGGWRYLCSKTNRIQRLIGNVPQEDLSQFPPVKKRQKGVLECFLMFGASLLFLYLSFIRGRFPSALFFMSIMFTFYGLIIIVFSFRYLSK